MKLSIYKGRNNHLLAFEYNCVVCQDVFKALKGVSGDWGLVKANKKQEKILLSQVNLIDPYGYLDQGLSKRALEQVLR